MKKTAFWAEIVLTEVTKDSLGIFKFIYCNRLESLRSGFFVHLEA